MPFAWNHVCAKVRISYEACQIGLDRWLSGQPCAPVAQERVEVGGYDNAAGTRETAEMRDVSWVFAPVPVQKHNIVVSFQLRKDVLSSSMENIDASGETSLLERLLCKSRMLRILLNGVHTTAKSCGRSHHGSRVPVATTNL